jgi:hypothetical protein
VPVGKSSGVSKVVSQQPTAGTADATSSGAWNQGIVADATYITSSIPTAANPNNVQKATQKELIRKFLEMSPQERIGIGNQLKAAGYRVGGLTGQATTDLRNAYLKAYDDLNKEIILGQQLDFDTFLTRERGATAAGGGGGAGPRQPYTQTDEINDMSAKTLIDGIVKSLTGRPKATPEELEKYTAMIRAQQKKNPLVTSYTTKGGQTVGAKTTGGFGAQEAQQFLIDKISQGDEAKATRALDAYSTVVEMFGGLR